MRVQFDGYCSDPKQNLDQLSIVIQPPPVGCHTKSYTYDLAVTLEQKTRHSATGTPALSPLDWLKVPQMLRSLMELVFSQAPVVGCIIDFLVIVGPCLLPSFQPGATLSSQRPLKIHGHMTLPWPLSIHDCLLLQGVNFTREKYTLQKDPVLILESFT